MGGYIKIIWKVTKQAILSSYHCLC